jgi:hypothetical protein
VAERAQVTRPTLRKVERGDPSVAMGTYATVLWVLGMGKGVAELAAPAADTVGLSMADEDLPKRVHPISRKHARAPRSDPQRTLDSTQLVAHRSGVKPERGREIE